jgi:hypothetical protein
MASIARNDPCPCGSGKKYKRCCGVSGADTPAADVKLPDPGPVPILIEVRPGTYTYKRFADTTALEMRAAVRLIILKKQDCPPDSAGPMVMEKTEELRAAGEPLARVEIHLEQDGRIVAEKIVLDAKRAERERPRVAGDPPDRKLDWVKLAPPPAPQRPSDVPPVFEVTAPKPGSAVIPIKLAMLQQSEREIRDCLVQVAAVKLGVARHYVNIADLGLYADGDFMDAFDLMASKTGSACPFEMEWTMAVWRHFTEAQAAAYSVEHLVDLLQNIQYLRSPPIESSLGEYRVQLFQARGRKRGKIVERRFADVDGDELEESAKGALRARLEELGIELHPALFENDVVDEDLPGELAFPQPPLPRQVAMYERLARTALVKAFGSESERGFAVFWRGGALYERRNIPGRERAEIDGILDSIPKEMNIVALPH